MNKFKKMGQRFSSRKALREKKKPKGKSVWLNKDQLHLIGVCIQEMGPTHIDYPWTDWQREVLKEVDRKIGCAKKSLGGDDE